jgi:hypothetical protein
VAIEPLPCLQAALAETSATTGGQAWTALRYSAVLQLLRSRRCRR